LGFDDGTILLLFAGNNYRLKGLEPLLHAVAILKGVSLRFPAPGRTRRGQIRLYRRKQRDLELLKSVAFPWPVPGMQAYYGASDIYVHPTFYRFMLAHRSGSSGNCLLLSPTRFNGASDAILSDEGGKIVQDPANAAEIADAIGVLFR